MDQGRLRHILVNLLSNAVKFTDKGEVAISVSSESFCKDRFQILFEVRDTGIGIPQEKMDRLFQPFDQLESVISLKREGLGLGLAICHKLIDLMGGVIWAESNPGRGSIFCFTVQAKVAPCKDLGSRRASMEHQCPPPLSVPPAPKPLKILVAEDNPSNQKIMLAMLNRLGHNCKAVANGSEVLHALQIRDYDLILMDLKMPEMDGLVACRIIRGLFSGKRPRIVDITANGSENDRERCLEAGMDDYIAKPVKLKALEDTINKIFGSPGQSYSGS